VQPTKPGTGKPEFAILVDDKRIVFHDPVVTGKEILQKAGYKPTECYVLYQKFKDCDFERISPDEKVDLAKNGLEKFTVKETEIFHYTVDDEPETSDKKFMTANEILAAAGLEPKDYYLVEVFPDSAQKSYKDNANEPIQLKCPGNKFISVFKGETPVS
jgi:hypothetical protein